MLVKDIHSSLLDLFVSYIKRNVVNTHPEAIFTLHFFLTYETNVTNKLECFVTG
jgi:hypothetical protein